MNTGSRIFVADGGTALGGALLRRLAADRFTRVLGTGAEAPNLRDRASVDAFFERARPEYVFLVGGKSAGIGGNQRFPADLMLDNLLLAAHVIPDAWRHDATKLLYVASSCVYPNSAPQPFRPDALWTGPVEPTSVAYAVARLAGIKLCEAYRQQHNAPFVTAIAGDSYGPGDDFSPDDSHVVGALMRRMAEARDAGAPAVEIWGSGAPMREFVYVDDLADACIFTMQHYEGSEPLNLGTGIVTAIADLARMISDIVGYTGELRFDCTKPDGMPFKGLDSTLLHDMGWRPRWSLRQGLEETFRWFLSERQASASSP